MVLSERVGALGANIWVPSVPARRRRHNPIDNDWAHLTIGRCGRI